MAKQSVFTKLSEEAKKKLKKIAMPSWIKPMLATLTTTYFSKPTWIYEHKWDGERIIAYKKNDTVELFTRNRKRATEEYPLVVEGLRKQKADSFIIDGEMIAYSHSVDDSNFSLLQRIMHAPVNAITKKFLGMRNVDYCIFDVMYLDGYDTMNAALLDRKILLSAFDFKKPLVYTEHILKEGERYYKQACKKGWEGVIAKDGLSPYIQARSKSWLKFKCFNQEEFVIGGYTSAQGSRLNFGALLVGYYKDDNLVYAGKIGTGFTTSTLRTLGEKLFSLERKTSPFVDKDIETQGVHWVKPVLVAEIKFSEWTAYDKLRHPVFMGLRKDKSPLEVTRETAKRVQV